MKTAHFHDVFMVLPVILYKIIGFSWYMPNSQCKTIITKKIQDICVFHGIDETLT